VIERIAEAAHEPDVGRYPPQPGLPTLRTAFANDLSHEYGADISADSVLITAGCNQAFCIAASALTSPGDEALLVSPFYFNHDMWLRLEGIHVRHLEPGPDLIPDPEHAEHLLTDKTRLITLVSPGNPTGVTIPKDVIHRFADLARRHNIALIVDETYRSFRDQQSGTHQLFENDDWTDHVISLHSFSKDFAIPGYRCGAVVGGSGIITQSLKILDCVAISAPRIGQEAALAGLLHAQEWRLEQVARVRELEDRFLTVMANKPGGFEVVASGAYFGWVRQPSSDLTTAEVVRRLVLEHDVLVIPGTAFTPDDEAMLRMSFANLSPAEINELKLRLAEFA
tara:strand:+ start:6389 stop:7405 length:1017 start_codon:yes stop_codon:yes gene_type:complete